MTEQVNLASHPVKNLEAYNALLQLDQQEQNSKAKQGYLKAYFLSIFLPPIGFYYFLKYFFFTEESYSSRKNAVLCLILTTISLLLNFWIIQLFLNQTTVENYQNLNFMKELITPENQKTLEQLLR